MKKHRVAVVAAVAALAAAGVWWRARRGGGEDAVTRRVEARRGDLEITVDATGVVAPLNRVEIKPPLAGRIEALLTAEGARVRKGDALAWMSSADRAAILDAARSQGPDAVKDWEDTYKPTPIVAPLDGEIILKNIVVGQTVDAGTVLFALSDRLIVVAQVDEVDIGRVAVGGPARVVLDAYPSLVLKGRVFNILHEGKNVSNVITYGVKVELEEPPRVLRSQMTATVSFVLEKKSGVVLLPAAAVREGPSGREVLVPGPDGAPQARPVTVGLDNGDTVEIVSGLAAGDAALIVQKRYVPQKGEAASPLVATPPGGRGMGGSRRNNSR